MIGMTRLKVLKQFGSFGYALRTTNLLRHAPTPITHISEAIWIEGAVFEFVGKLFVVRVVLEGGSKLT
jgi:hypothetical protein